MKLCRKGMCPGDRTERVTKHLRKCSCVGMKEMGGVSHENRKDKVRIKTDF